MDDTGFMSLSLSLSIIRQIHDHPNFVAFLLEENIYTVLLFYTLEELHLSNIFSFFFFFYTIIFL